MQCILNVMRKSISLSNFRKYHSIAQICKAPEIGSKVNLKGWVKALRKMKTANFINLSDGSSFENLQVVIPKEIVSKDLTYGCSVEVAGVLKQLENGQLEIKADEVNVVGPCVVAEGYPFQPRKSYDPDYIRQYLHLRNRTNTFASLLRLRSSLTNNIHNYFQNNEFINIHTPILTSNDCEGAGEVFTVVPDSQRLIKQMSNENVSDEKQVFFGHKTFLSVSGQLHLEAMARSLSKVYSFNPIFRAENSKSRLHLSEFYMIESEIAFINNIQDLCSIIEKFIKSIIQNLHVKEVLAYRKFMNIENLDDLKHILDNPFIIMSYNAAVTVLKRNGFTISLDDGLSKQHEMFLIKYTNNIPIFIINWPTKTKPFYMKKTSDPEQVAAVDLLFPIVGEICGGGLREDNYDTLASTLELNGLSNKLDWYLELRKYGNVPTGGFGLGFERLLQVITGNDNIKDVIPYPRYSHHCKM